MKFIEAAKNKKIGTTHKLKSYYDAYDFHFGQLDREKKYNILEIGIQDGGGLWTLKEYFFNSSITGLDIEESCKKYESKDDDVEVFIGNQEDVVTLEKIHKDRGPFDIIIDDGGHTMKAQLYSFFMLFNLLNNNGLYIIEDLHTSYWPRFGGGTNKRFKNNFITEDINGETDDRDRLLYYIKEGVINSNGRGISKEVMDSLNLWVSQHADKLENLWVNGCGDIKSQEFIEKAFILCNGYRDIIGTSDDNQDVIYGHGYETMMGVLKLISEKPTESWASRSGNAGRYKNTELELDYFDKQLDSIHFHDSICFIYKKYRENLDEFVKNYKQFSIRL